MEQTEQGQGAEGNSVALVETKRHELGGPLEAAAVALTAQVEAKIKAQFFLARQFPRTWMDVRTKLLKAFERPMLAEGAIYSKPMGGSKKVEGLSIRFAEEAFRAMGNIIVDTMLVSDDEDKRVYIVSGMDTETLSSIPMTVVVTKEMERSSVRGGDVVLRQRENSNGGKTYVIKARSEDDYRAKEMALLQKARRDVILFLTPGDIKEECEQKIRETVANRDKSDPQGAINRMVLAFHGVGVSAAEIEKYLKHKVETINLAELHVLRTLFNMIKEGEGTWSDVITLALGTNTGADEAAQGGAKKGATATLKDLAKSGPAAKPDDKEREHIDALRAKKNKTDEEKEDIRQWDADHPAPAAGEQA
jgi:hypothetical protein